MRTQTIYAGLYSLFSNIKVATAILSQMIERTIAKQAVKILWFISLMTWKIFTFFILEKFVVFHVNAPYNTKTLRLIIA